MDNSKLRRLLFILFFFSGLAALVYEVVWARKLSLIFGTTSYAVSSILAVFFAGLAFGSWIFGRWVDKGGNPLKTYAFLELGIGIYAALTPWIFRLIESIQIGFWQKFSASGGPTFSGFSVFTFGLSFLGLIIPTTLIGGTLPVLSKFWVRKEEEIGGGVGALYFINTVGAVVGAFLAGFVLIATIGVNETIWLAALINLVIGGIVLYLSRIKANPSTLRQAQDSGQVQRMKANELIEKRRSIRSLADISSQFAQISVLAAFAAAGFSALALEVLWTRVLVMVIGGSVYAFTIVLVVFLVGIALGSAVMTRFTDRLRNVLLWFAGIEILLGISVILLTPLLGDLPFWFLSIFKSFGESFASLQFGLFLLALLVMIGPTLLMGAAFPVVVTSYRAIKQSRDQAIERSSNQVGGQVGEVYAANTVGGILGALAAGFVLIPAVGVQEGILVSAGIYLLMGAGIVFIAEMERWLKCLLLGLVVLSGLLVFYLPSWNRQVLGYGIYVNPAELVGKSQEEIVNLLKTEEILFQREGISAHVEVRKDNFSQILSLRIDGKADASTGEDMENQLLAGHLPMLFHPNPERILVIGLGSGITLGAVEQYPAKEIVAIEIEPAVVKAAQYFADFSHDALADPRLKMIVADGRNYLLTTDKRFDVITSEPSNPWLAGPSKLFTKEYFELMKNRLTKDGVALQWINLYSFAEDDLRTLVATFKSVFPSSLAFNVLTSDDLLLVGAKNELVLDLEQIETKMKQEKVKADLSRIAIEDPLALLSYLTMDKEAMEKFSQDAPLNTDNHPILEFSAPKSLYLLTQAGNLREIMEFWIDPLTLISADPSTSSGQVERINELVKFREHFAKMLIAWNEDNVGEGIKEGEAAWEIKKDHPGMNSYLSRLYFEKGNWLLRQQKEEEAKKDLTRSLEIMPRTQTRIVLGSIYKDEGKLQEAQEEFKTAVEQSPELAIARFNLGLVLEQTGDLNRAIEEFEKTLELDPEYSRAHEELVKLYEMRGDYGKAEKHRKITR